ncbi:MAG: S1 RNA-binding domain-containing protein, partial [Gemmatimonadota bacterium]|nr:S1 RNA-binding domain-containing protein [Gemmatimonadota bacterium]
SIGDEIEAVVLKVDPKDEKISLGMKQIEEDPWLALPVKYPTSTKLSGTVRNLTSFGAFVEIEPGIDGLVHVSDMSWTRRVEHPSEVVQKGQELEVMVLDVDAENKRISLGVKQLQEDPWPSISERFAPGVEPDGTVVRMQDKGLVVDLGDEIEGFVPVSHSLVDDPERLEEHYAQGDTISLRILESDAANRRIVMEVTELPPRKSQDEIDAARAAALAAAAAAEAAANADDDDDEMVSSAVLKHRTAEPEAGTEAAAVAPVSATEGEAAATAAAEAPAAEAAKSETPADEPEADASADVESEGSDGETEAEKDA